MYGLYPRSPNLKGVPEALVFGLLSHNGQF
jgi:hypothetical protein